MTGSSRRSWHTDLNRIDETRANITVEEGDLLVNEKNIDRQTYAHHSYQIDFIADQKFERVQTFMMNFIDMLE